MKINSWETKNNCSLWNSVCLFFSMKTIVLLVYLYSPSFFAKFDTCEIERIWWLAKLNTCDFKNFQHSQRYTHVKSNSFKAHSYMAYSVNTMHSLLPPIINTIKRKICNISHKFMIKVTFFRFKEICYNYVQIV